MFYVTQVTAYHTVAFPLLSPFWRLVSWILWSQTRRVFAVLLCLSFVTQKHKNTKSIRIQNADILFYFSLPSFSTSLQRPFFQLSKAHTSHCLHGYPSQLQLPTHSLTRYKNPHQRNVPTKPTHAHIAFGRGIDPRSKRHAPPQEEGSLSFHDLQRKLYFSCADRMPFLSNTCLLLVNYFNEMAK